MKLADRLRQALERGRRQRPILLAGDLLDEERDEVEGANGIAEAAVLVPIVERPNPGIILTLRPETMRRHAGQISFPGGRIDPGDDGPVSAALREAEEEIGLSPQEVEVIGTGDLYRTITGFDITPVLGILPPDLPLDPHPGEVDAVFEVPLDFLFDPANQKVKSVQWRGRERCYYEILWGDRRIWGATAAMIVNLSRRLEFAE
jgi:8-oxo-dGTP pyrophosphatase MutT (NUDIX family)